jgi:hypothetical protein
MAGKWSTPTRRSLGVFAIAVLLAMPMYWLGFIERKMIWIVPGVVIILLARAFREARSDRDHPATSAAD